MQRLNIFVDETGEFGFGKGASELYGISFTFHEQNDDIMPDMLTYIDKYDYKYKNKMTFTKGEKYFFSVEEIRRVLKELNKKRF